MNLKELITSNYEKLSKTQQKLASYLLDHYQDIAVLSANELGKKAEVSETTVIRFCYRLGLSGYTQLQKEVREHLLQDKSSLDSYIQTKQPYIGEPHFLEKVMKLDADRIHQAIETIDETSFDLMIDCLKSAKKIYIIGARTSFAAANWLAFTLGLVKEEVHLIRTESDDLLKILHSMDETTALISISFHRYVKSTTEFTRQAKKQKAKVIGITDTPFAPLKANVDLLMPLFLGKKPTLDATPVLFSFLNALIAAMMTDNNDKCKQEKGYDDQAFLDYFESS